MRATSPICLVLALSGFLSINLASAQQTEKSAGKKPSGPSPAVLAKLNETLATVNGEKVTRGEVVQVLQSFNISPGGEKSFYDQAVDMVISAKLQAQFVRANGGKIEPKDLENEIEYQKKMLAENNQSLEAALVESGTSYDQLKLQLTEQLLWRKYIQNTATDAVLQRFMKDNIDVFNRSMVKASQIQLNVDPKASAEDKAKAIKKLEGIRQDILANKITFADAANKHSEDPSNVEQPSGGDLRYFPRKKFVEPFDSTAFSLKVGEISKPIETEYGMHLIMVTDRKPGVEVEFARAKEGVLYQFAHDELERVVTEMKKKAKIEIKPMPADLFPKRETGPFVDPIKPKG